VLRLITLGRLLLLRDGPPSEAIHLQPKRLALLAYLALTARDGYQQRDTVLALFWPRADREQARRCLRQALFHLRNELGDGVLVNYGRDGLALAPERLWCDAAAVEHALRSGRPGDALELYAGDFLPGVFTGHDGMELEEWIGQTRRRLRAAVVGAAWELADAQERAGRTARALELAQRARFLSPEDEQGLRRHMALLARAGDAAAALGAYADFSRRLRREYDAEPSAASDAMASELRRGRTPELSSPPLEPATYRRPTPGANRVELSNQPSPASSPSPRGPRSIATGRRVRRMASAGLALAAAAVLTEPTTRESLSHAAGRLVLAEFINHTRDSLLGAAVTEAVRSELSRVARVDLAGVHALQRAALPGQLGTGPPTPGAIAPGQVLILVTGDIRPLGSGFAVSARLITAGSGRLLGIIREEAADSEALQSTVRRLSKRLQGDVLQTLGTPETGSLDERRR
jgi:DNA-binding SARP family transcriptional activator